MRLRGWLTTVLPIVLLVLAAFGVAAGLGTGDRGSDGTLPAAAPATTSQAEGDASRPPTLDDPELLATWFEAEMRRELAREGGAERPAGNEPRPSEPVVRRVFARTNPSPAVSAGPPMGRTAHASGDSDARLAREQARRIAELRDREGVDWDYVDDVFAGRVSGIPSERRAGLTLEEIDTLGEIPYVQELRDQGREAELRDLGLHEKRIVCTGPSGVADVRERLSRVVCRLE